MASISLLVQRTLPPPRAKYESKMQSITWLSARRIERRYAALIGLLVRVARMVVLPVSASTEKTRYVSCRPTSRY